MARLSTCKGCSKKLQPEEKHNHGSKTYCVDCVKKVEREATEYKQLIEFICTNYELERPTGLILKQIKEYKTDFGYTHAAMTYTLWYCKEVLSKEFIEKFGVALIKHYYDEAKDYYLQQEKMKESISRISQTELKTKVIKMTNKKSSSMNDNSSLINLGSLLEGGDAH